MQVAKSGIISRNTAARKISRTSKKVHHETSIDLFNLLKEKDLFSLIESEQFFDINENQFLADRYITGDCPLCAFEGAYGDQCEKCGSALSPEELKNPKSTISDSTPILKKTKHYYIKLNEFEDFLRDWITVENNDIWKANVIGQVKSWLDSCLLYTSPSPRDCDRSRMPSSA